MLRNRNIDKKLVDFQHSYFFLKTTPWGGRESGAKWLI